MQFGAHIFLFLGPFQNFRKEARTSRAFSVIRAWWSEMFSEVDCIRAHLFGKESTKRIEMKYFTQNIRENDKHLYEVTSTLFISAS